ncbi:hypothetical protein T06_10532 [Trichinella sp. T6]|nr:hypothetical protein T06_10532 [Trichinella sp. T6]
MVLKLTAALKVFGVLRSFPRLPEHRHDLVLADQFKTTKSGEDFLLCQSNCRHILIFATGTNIRLLAACRTWGMDGTFKIVPQWYQQLFTIHAFVAGKLVPAVYCLCTGKDIGKYGYIFQALIDKAAVLEVDLNPDTIIYCPHSTFGSCSNLVTVVTCYAPVVSSFDLSNPVKNYNMNVV